MLNRFVIIRSRVFGNVVRDVATYYHNRRAAMKEFAVACNDPRNEEIVLTDRQTGRRLAHCDNVPNSDARARQAMGQE